MTERSVLLAERHWLRLQWTSLTFWMPLCQGIPVLSLRQESPFLLCGLQGCGKISLLTAVTGGLGESLFTPLIWMEKGRKENVGRGTCGQRGSEVHRMGSTLSCCRQFCACAGGGAGLMCILLKADPQCCLPEIFKCQ